jgi:hypothetical protein
MMTRVETFLARRRFIKLLAAPLLFFLTLESLMYFIELVPRIIPPNCRTVFAAEHAIAFHAICFLTAFGIFGLIRGATAHPALNSAYASWLESTAWHLPLPLPGMPVHLVWEDALVLGLLEIDRHFLSNRPYCEGLSVFLFLYLLSQLFVLARDKSSHPHLIVLAFGLPGLALLIPNFVEMAALMGFLFLVTLDGQRQLLNAFPWPSSKPRSLNLGPLGLLGPVAKGESRSHALLHGVYAGWFFYCGIHLIKWILKLNGNPSDIDMLTQVLYFVPAIAAITRLIVYVANYRPPLSIPGRLATGRILLPRYDCVLIAPLVIGLFTLVPVMLENRGVPLEIHAAITVCISIIAAFDLPPSLKWWKLCGEHRIQAILLFKNGETATESRVSIGKSLWFGLRPPPLLLVPWWYVATYVLLLGLCSYDQQSHPEILLFTGGAVGYALYRVATTYPRAELPYGKWLRTTPWDHTKALPLGPVHLVWQDLLALLLLEASIRYTFPGFPLGLATLFFLVTHVLFIVPILSSKQRVIAAILSTGTPLVLCFMPGPYGKLLGIAGLAVIGQIGLRHWLAGFRNELFVDAVREPIAKVFDLNFRESQPFFRNETFVSISMWVYAICSLIEFAGRPAKIGVAELKVAVLVQSLLLYPIFLRILRYISTHHPPLSLAWRFRNGLLIPRYDKVFLAPIVIALFVILGPTVLHQLGLSAGVAISLVTLIALFANRYAGPSFRDWQLTGFHSISLDATPTREFRSANNGRRT